MPKNIDKLKQFMTEEWDNAIPETTTKFNFIDEKEV